MATPLNLNLFIDSAPPLNTDMTTRPLDDAELADKRAATSDTASLLRGLLGVRFQSVFLRF